MARTTTMAFLACLFWMASAVAQETLNVTGKSDQKLLLGFRMLDWKVKHMHDTTAASSHADTLRKLGCEVKTAEHNGHIDVSCRTVFWKSLALDSQAQMQQWQAWLIQAGFETLYGYPATADKVIRPDGTPAEIVKYRLVDWRSQHVHQPAEVGQLTTIYRSLGCELQNVKHGNHIDLRYRCPSWTQIELPNHDAAHKWQEFLNRAGFETSHEH